MITKRPLLLSDLEKSTLIDKAIIESIEQALFRLELELNGHTYYVLEAPGKMFSRRSIIEVQAELIPFQVAAIFLRHISPYDEMIGHDVNDNTNEMLLPVGNYFASDLSGSQVSDKLH